MRVYHPQPKAYYSGAWHDQTPTSVVVQTMAGATVETLTPHQDADGDWYADTTDGSYVDGTKYRALWHATILGSDRTATKPFRHVGSPPDPGTLSVANNGDGASVTATVTCAVGATALLLHKTDGETAWTAGESRVGSGEIVQDDLTDRIWYQFVLVVQSGGANSLPSRAVAVYVTSSSADEPDGPISWPPELLRDLVAASPTFQATVGATQPSEEERVAAARLSTYLAEVPDPVASRPFAVVDQADQGERWQARLIAEDAFRYGGALFLAFEADVPAELAEADHESEAQRWLSNWVGVVVKEVKAGARTSGNLLVRNVSLVQGPLRIAKELRKDEGDHFFILFLVVWG